MDGNRSESKAWSGSRRLVIAFTSCVLGVGLILLVLQIGPESDDKTVEKKSSAEAQPKKIHRAWNIALGNVVVVAPDLGLNARASKGGRVEETKITARLESQLQGLREFYRQESEKDPVLMGGMLLQLTVSPSGDVTYVKEIVSRIADSEFKKAVLADASKWTFPDIMADTTTIICPLLFVREGMDITTIVQWEKTLGQFNEKSALAKTDGANKDSQAPDTRKRADAVAKTTAPANKAKGEKTSEAKSLAREYHVKHPTAIREEPSFTSASIGKFTAGTKVTIISSHGDWLQVRADESGLAGFIRREFVAAVELTQKTKSVASQ
jgi:hypothetical protein